MKDKPIFILDPEQIKDKYKIWRKSDFFDQELEELFNILNPSLRFAPNYKKLLAEFRLDHSGTWVYFPWNGCLTHILEEREFFLVRTNRNKNIINSTQQEKIYNFNVGVVGMSIGSGMAISLACSGFAKNMKLVDFDTLELSNLNRISASVSDLGQAKIEIIARKIYEINPFANLTLFPQGLSQNNLKVFIEGSPKPQVIYEAIDDFEMKIRIRLAAKSAKIPVIMLTNLGDRLMIDVERYDLDPKLPLFNGLIGNTAEEILSRPISEEDKQKYAVAIVGKENIPKPVFDSVMQVGKTLVGRPQIMSTVTISAGVAAHVLQRLVIDNTLPSGRKVIDFSSII